MSLPNKKKHKIHTSKRPAKGVKSIVIGAAGGKGHVSKTEADIAKSSSIVGKRKMQVGIRLGKEGTARKTSTKKSRSKYGKTK